MRFFRKPNRSMFLDWRGYVLGIAFVAFATWLKYLAQPNIITAPNSLLYILVILITAILFGFGPAIFVSLLSIAAYIYFFLQPVFNFYVVEVQQAVTLVIFLAVAVVISYLASSLRKKTVEVIQELSARRKSEAELARYRDQLEDLVKQRTAELERVNLDLKNEIIEHQKAELRAKQYTDDLLVLSRAATALVELLPEGDIYQFTAEQVYQMVPEARMVIVSSFDDSTGLFQVQAFSGDPQNIAAFAEMTGRELEGLIVPLTAEGRQALTSRKLQIVPGGVFDLTAGLIPQDASKQIEKHFGIGNIYTVGFYRKGILYGSVNILMGNNDILRNPNIVETFIHQAGTALQLKKTLDALERAKGDLEVKVHERTRDLEESEEKYRLLVENASEAVVVFQDNTVKFFNRKALEMSGYSQEELTSLPLVQMVHPDDRNMVIIRHRKRISGESAPTSYEFRIIHKNGSVLWVNINAVRITWGGAPAVLGLMTDITERKNMEEELQAYARKITQVQEEERKRIAYELHDDTAQYLAILKLQLDSLIHSGKIEDPQVLKKLEYLEKDAGRTVDDVRRYSHELRPGVLEHLGLLAALEQIAEDINKLQQIKVTVKSEGEEQPISEDIKLGFFRIAQEALNNARKHARAANARVYLKYETNRLQMTVSDDGMGFDVQKAKTQAGLKGSLGLVSMQERAKLIGADLKIYSKPGQGTRITLQASLTP